MVKPADRSKVFISYSHADEAWLKRLQVHLKPLERAGALDRWDDTRIAAGQKWRSEIKAAVDAAAAAILLVSADFLASDFIDGQELPPLLQAAEQRGIVILPLIVSPCRFAETEGLAQFQAVNPPTEPLIGMDRCDQERTFVDLANRIAQLIDQAKAPTPMASPVEEELIQEDVFHPAKTATSRGGLSRCSFYISPFYRKTRLWEYLADVLVLVHHPLLAEETFLIPSGWANPHLSDAVFLRDRDGRRWLDLKRQATLDFIGQHSNRLLEGAWFKMQTKTGERFKVYSLAYDKFLNAAASALPAAPD